MVRSTFEKGANASGKTSSGLVETPRVWGWDAAFSSSGTLRYMELIPILIVLKVYVCRLLLCYTVYYKSIINKT